jgi:hypothetical protein
MTFDERELDYELTRAARSLHREWDSPDLWPAIAAGMRPGWQRWQTLAAAAAIVLFAGGAWITGGLLRQADSRGAGTGASAAGVEESRLLSDEAFAEIERSEAQYVRALQELSRLVAPKLAMPESPLLVNLQARLDAIDAAIDESRRQIQQNPFNAQLRRQLLYILQEKRLTLEQVQQHEDNNL